MIPYQGVLLGWVFVSILLMTGKDSARGFSLAFIGGVLFLPAGALSIELPGLPDLGRRNVTTLGVLLGTVLFHPQLLINFRPRKSDLLLFTTVIFLFITSVVNNFGAYDGFSKALDNFLSFILPVFLARIHLSGPNGVKTFVMILVWGSVIYTPLAAYEFRMSPQIHSTLYGSFQHVFFQHARGGHWRPIVCFGHALALGRFFAFCAFMAAFPLRKEFVKRLGSVGNFVFLMPLLGLILSQSLSPYIIFLLLCVLYGICRKAIWVAYLLPVGAFIWLTFVFSGFQPLSGVVDVVEVFNPARAQSLHYRLQALNEYRVVILSKPVFGHGGWGSGRITGRATDSVILVNSLSRGLVGASFLYIWWLWAMHINLRVSRRTRGSPFGPIALGISMMPPIGLAVSAIDAALDGNILFLTCGLMSVDTMLRSMPSSVPRPRPPTAPEEPLSAQAPGQTPGTTFRLHPNKNGFSPNEQ